MSASPAPAAVPYPSCMSSEDPFGGLFGDPDELSRRMEQFAE